MNEKDKSHLAYLRARDNVDSMLEKLASYWARHPYLRLAQIVSNAWRAHPDYKRNPEPDIQDIFYLTDEKFLEGLAILEKNESKDS